MSGASTSKNTYIHTLEARIRYLEKQLRDNGQPIIEDDMVMVPPDDSDAYRALVDQSLIGMDIVQDERIVFCNQAFADMLGYTVDELIAMSADEVIKLNHEDYHDTIQRRHPARLAGEKVENRFIQRMVCKDGSIRWVELHATRIIYMGKPAVHAAFMDITERKQTEEAYSALTHHEAIGVNITQDEHFVFCNKAFADMIGYTVDELMTRQGNTLWELVHPDDRHLITNRHQKRLQGATSNPRYDIRVFHRDGTTRWLEIYATGVEFKGRRAVQSTFIDITERKQAEQDLSKREAQFRTLAENSPDFISRLDLDGRYIYVNQAVVDSLGKPLADILGSTALDNGMTPDLWATTKTYHDQVIATSEPIVYDYMVEIPNRATIFVQTHVVPEFNAQGEIETILSVSRDLSAIKQAEEDLRRSQRFTEQVMYTVPDMVYVYDLVEARNIYVNRQIGEMLGYTQAEVARMGNTFLQQIIHPEDWADYPQKVTKLLQMNDDDIYEHEYRVQNTDGKWVWLRSRETAFLRDDDGNVQQILGIAQDITESKHIQQEIASSRANLLALIENTEDSIWSVNRNLEIVIINSYVRKMFKDNFDIDLAPGTDALAGLNPTQKTIWRDFYHRALSGEAVREDWSYVINGKLRQFDVSLTPIRDEDGKITGVSVVSRDVTERRIIEQERDYNVRFINKIMEVAPYGIYVYDFAKRKNVYSNARNAELLELPVNEMEQVEENTLFDRIHPDDVSGFLSLIDRDLNAKDGEVITHEIRLQRTNGEWRWISLSNVVFKRGAAGVVEQILGLSVDITEEKAAEERDRKYRMEQERVSLITSFIQAVSHEFRTPLSTINTSTYLLQRSIEDERPPEMVKKYINRITQESRQILDLVQALLTMSQLDSGMDLHFTSLYPSLILQDLITHMGKESGTALFISVDEAAQNTPILGNGEYLDIAFTRLLDNAIRYSPPDMPVHITVSQADVNHIKITIRDEGSGITEEAMPYIFDRFFRGDTARSTRGFGVGLPIAQKIIDRHQGTLSVMSKPEKGTKVVIRLPIATQQDPPTQPTP